jgi:catechol 2,3-dioxygenase-like lactoylglutathione lyase family enzyme
MAKLRHIAINTPNLDEDAKFFCEAFGLTEISRVGTPPQCAIYLSDGVINVAMINITDPEFPNYNPKGLNHIGFVVEDMDAAIKQAEQAGAVATVDRDNRMAGVTWEMKMKTPSGLAFDLSDHGWPGVGALS